jgi:glucuronokinase
MSTVRRGRGVAFARAALAGNPSDAYEGAVVALTLGSWSAQVEIEPSARLAVTPGSPLVGTTVWRFAQEFDPAALTTSVQWTTSIPRGVGLGGSSALVIATARALCRLFRKELEPDRLAEFALAVETEGLGIVAGPQDRVAQSYGGLMFMDFGLGKDGNLYERLDMNLLPPLLIAWRDDAAKDSGDVHRALLERHRDGDEEVRQAMSGLAAAARDARSALLSGDTQRLCECVDRSFDLRRQLVELDQRCVEMVEVARQHGAAANYTGSGGAIVAVCRDWDQLELVKRGLRLIECHVSHAP